MYNGILLCKFAFDFVGIVPLSGCRRSLWAAMGSAQVFLADSAWLQQLALPMHVSDGVTSPFWGLSSYIFCVFSMEFGQPHFSIFLASCDATCPKSCPLPACERYIQRKFGWETSELRSFKKWERLAEKSREEKSRAERSRDKSREE